MKIFINFILLAVLLQGCYSSGEKKDLIAAQISVKKLQEDLSILKGVITNVHAGAYSFNTPAQLKFLFDSIAASITEPLTTREFYNKVDCIIDRLKCIHSNIIIPDEYYDSLEKKPLFFPVPLMAIGDKLFVNSETYTMPLGSEIISINGNSGKAILEKLKSYRHTDGNSNVIKTSVVEESFPYSYYLAYGGADQFSIKYTPYKKDTVETRLYTTDKLNDIYKNEYNETYYFYPTDAAYDFEMIDKRKTAILTLRTFHFTTNFTTDAYNHFIENSFRQIKQNGIKNLVIDCRNNGGGYYSCTYSLLSYLVNKKMVEFDSAIKRYDKLTYTTFIDAEDTARIRDEDTSGYKYTEIRKGIYSLKQSEITEWKPDEKYAFKGRLFVVVNSHVISAASTFAAVLKDKTNAFILGEETGGGYAAHNSSVITYVLPNSQLKINVPTQRFYQPVKEIEPGRGVQPHKYIPFTINDLVEKRDKPMEYIFDSILVH